MGFKYNPFTKKPDWVGAALENPLQFKGTIDVSADFPIISEVKAGWFYRVTSDVVDNDPTKTNTGQSFQSYDEIVWNGSAWDTMGNLRDVDYIDFDTTLDIAHQEGRLHWNSDDGTLEIGMPGGNVNLQIGQETLIRATNKEGSGISNGQLVYVSGASGANPHMKLAKADVPGTSSGTIAMATEDVSNNQKGYFNAFGLVRDVDTSGCSEGDTLYLSASTAGAFTNVKPAQPGLVIKVGYCLRAHATEGVVFVKIAQRTNNYENIRGLTAGSIPYANANGFLDENNTDLYYDYTNLRLGLGTNTPLDKLHVQGGNLRVVGGDINLWEDDAEFRAVTLQASNSYGNVIVREDGDTKILITSNPASDTYFNSDNNFGIGVETPLKKLHVADDDYTTGVRAFFGNSVYDTEENTIQIGYSPDSNANSVELGHKFASGASTDTGFARLYGGVDALEWDISGNVTVGRALEVTAEATIGGTADGLSTINQGLVINNSSGSSTDCDFTVKTDNVADAVFVDSSEDEMEINIPTKIGDVSGGNYSEIESDGTYVAKGDATVFRDELHDMITAGKNNPSAKVVDNYPEGSVTYGSNADLTEYVIMNVQLNHDWKLGTDIEPHIHWWQTSSDMPNWLIEYRWQRGCQSKTTAWTAMPWSSNACTYTSGTICQITSFGTITPPTGYGEVSDIVQFRIYRDTDNDSGEFDGNDPENSDVDAMHFDVHIECDTLGSRQLYAK